MDEHGHLFQALQGVGLYQLAEFRQLARGQPGIVIQGLLAVEPQQCPTQGLLFVHPPPGNLQKADGIVICPITPLNLPLHRLGEIGHGFEALVTLHWVNTQSDRLGAPETIIQFIYQGIHHHRDRIAQHLFFLTVPLRPSHNQPLGSIHAVLFHPLVDFLVPVVLPLTVFIVTPGGLVEVDGGGGLLVCVDIH